MMIDGLGDDAQDSSRFAIRYLSHVTVTRIPPILQPDVSAAGPDLNKSP